MYRKRKFRVIDTTALLTWHIPDNDKYQNVTVSAIINEIKKDELTRTIIESYLESGKIRVLEPSEDSIKKATRKAVETGDKIRMSDSDLRLLALAIELKNKGYYVEVITDDFAIQNILKRLNIKTYSYFREIREAYNWILICEKCGHVYPSDYMKTYCEYCGGRIIRRRIKVNKHFH